MKFFLILVLLYAFSLCSSDHKMKPKQNNDISMEDKKERHQKDQEENIENPAKITNINDYFAICFLQIHGVVYDLTEAGYSDDR